MFKKGEEITYRNLLDLAEETSLEEVHEESRADSMAESRNSYIDRNACKVCLEATVEILFRPCKHIVCCETCSVELSTCPVCRCDIADRERVYLP